MNFRAGVRDAGSKHGWSVTIVAGILAGLTVAIAAPAQATPNVAKAWGKNDSGQLGNGTGGTGKKSDVPVAVQGLSGVVAVSSGLLHSLALLEDGKVMAWGNNGSGQLGDGTTKGSSVPVEVSALVGVKAVAAGEGHSLALLADGRVMAWR